MCLPTISCRIRYSDLANIGQPLLRCITIPVYWLHNLHIGDISWPSIWCFIEFTRSTCSCTAHTIASVSFLRCPPTIATFTLYSPSLYLLGIYHGTVSSSHWVIFSSFECFLNISRSSTSGKPFSPATIFIIHSSLSLRYLSKFCTSTFTHYSHNL